MADNMCFLVGSWCKGGSWAVEGVYDKEEDAIDNCEEGMFLMRIEKNSKLPNEVINNYPNG